MAGSGFAKGLANYGDAAFSLFLRKAFVKGAGYSGAALDRPVIGVVNTASAYNPCHGNMVPLMEAVKRGIFMAGGLPMEFPTISIGETFANPTSMYLRNLMAMDTEEMIRAQPMDAVVLIGGCDKTVPAQVMGAISAGVPAVQLVTGPMLTGAHQGERVGACTDCRRYWGRVPGRRSRRCRDRRGQRPAGRQRRQLRRDGHGLDHGVYRRGVGPGGPGVGHAAGGHGRPDAGRVNAAGCAPWASRMPG